MTSAIRTPNGGEVALAYRALTWGPKTLAAIQKQETETEEFRLYYTEKVLPALAVLATNVLLEGDGLSIAPGLYRIGFRLLPDASWVLVVSTDNPGREPIEAPIQVEIQAIETPFLFVSLVPGHDSEHVELVILYGPNSVRIPLMMSGVPFGSDVVRRLPRIETGNPALRVLNRAAAGILPATQAVESDPSAILDAKDAERRLDEAVRERWLKRSATPTPRLPSLKDR